MELTVGLLFYVLLPACMAGAATVVRNRSAVSRLLTFLAVGSALIVGWFWIAYPGQPWASAAFTVLIPLVSCFSVASIRRLQPAVAFLAAVAAVFIGAALGLFLGVNLGLVRP